jgi:hypothetical protein
MKNRITIESLLNSFDFFGNKDIVSYEFSVRNVPKYWNFMVMMGIREALSEVYFYRVDDDNIDELFDSFGFKYNLTDEFMYFVQDFRFTGDIQCIPEGEVVFPGDPIMTVTGAVSEIELIKNVIVDTLSKNIGTMTQCARCFLAANGTPIVNTSRSLLSSKLSYMAGFNGTTNISSNVKYKIPLFTNIDNISYVLSKNEKPNRDIRILDFNDIKLSLARDDCRGGIIKVRDKNLDVNLNRIADSGYDASSIMISCPDDIPRLSKASLLSQLWPATIFTNVKPVCVEVEAYPVYNHTQKKRLMVPTSGESTLPGIKKVYLDQRNGLWNHVISIDDLTQEGIDPLIEIVMKDGEIIEESIDIKATRSVCNGSLLSIPNELLNLNKSVDRPFKIHRSILDKYYQAYGELNE